MAEIEALVSAGGATRRLTIQRDADGLRLDLADLGLGGAWVTITLHDDPSAPREARPLMSLVVTDEARPGVPLADESLGAGISAWTGRVPAAIRALRIANLAGGRPPHPSRITIRRRMRPALVARAFARAPVHLRAGRQRLTTARRSLLLW